MPAGQGRILLSAITRRAAGGDRGCAALAWVVSDPDPELWTAIGFGLGRRRSPASVPAIRPRRRNPVIEMTATASVSRLGSEFDDFLYAPIGEDRNGMLLSVLSALARLDIDPWQEAAKLADRKSVV